MLGMLAALTVAGRVELAELVELRFERADMQFAERFGVLRL